MTSLSVTRIKAPVFVFCDGNGRHQKRRELFPLRRGRRVIIRCELCRVVWAQPCSQWDNITDALTRVGEHDLNVETLPALRRL